ncbi:MAG: glycosyltransferase [Vicinamibacterales bacterium]
MIRVVHLGKFYPPARGGMEQVIQALCENERRTVDVRALVANSGRATVHETLGGVPVTRVGAAARIGSVTVCPTLPLWLRRVRCDVLVVHEPNPVALVAFALARPRARLVVWFHSEVVRPAWRYRLFYRPFLRHVLTRADRIVVASPKLAEHAAELRDFRSKVTVIPFGIDADAFALTPAVMSRASAIRQRRAAPLLLFVGRMVPYKGVDVLLRAMVGLDAHAMLVGTGPMKRAWEELAASLGVRDRVSFDGEVDRPELVARYHACDVFVLPSVTRAEAFGMVQLEAMACGKPVVSTDLPTGVPWVNQDGISGRVVPPGDPNALRRALRDLLQDPAARRRMGLAARRRIDETFVLANMVGKTTSLYTELMASASGSTPVGLRRAEPSAGVASAASSFES